MLLFAMHQDRYQTTLYNLCTLCGKPLHGTQYARDVAIGSQLLVRIRIHEACFETYGADIAWPTPKEPANPFIARQKWLASIWEKFKHDYPEESTRLAAAKHMAQALHQQTGPKDILNRSITPPIAVRDMGAERGLRYVVEAAGDEQKGTLPEEMFWGITLYDVADFLARTTAQGRQMNTHPTQNIDHEKWETH